MEYLDFEQPIQELEEQLQKCAVIGDESDVDVTTTCQQIEDKLLSTKKEIYGNMTPWQRVQLSRHPQRPYTMDYIQALSGETFLELHATVRSKMIKPWLADLAKLVTRVFYSLVSKRDTIQKHASTAILEWQTRRDIERRFA